MHAGELIEVDFGVPAGSEPGFTRPAIVITAEAVLEARPRTLHVVPITGNVARPLPTEIPIEVDSLARPSAAQCHLCTVISVDRIKAEDLGNVGSAMLAQIRAVLGDLLDLPV